MKGYDDFDVVLHKLLLCCLLRAAIVRMLLLLMCYLVIISMFDVYMIMNNDYMNADAMLMILWIMLMLLHRCIHGILMMMEASIPLCGLG